MMGKQTKSSGIWPKRSAGNGRPPAPEALFCDASYSVVVTRGLEYHLVEEVCAGVRERATGKWHRAHEALGRRVGGSVLNEPGRLVNLPGKPRIGDAMWFMTDGEAVCTQPVLGVEQPSQITRSFLRQLTYRAAMPAESDVSAAAEAPEGRRDDVPDERPAAELAMKVNTVSMRPPRRIVVKPRFKLPHEKIFDIFSHIFVPATP